VRERIIPAIGLVQSYLKEVFPDSAVRISPLLGTLGPLTIRDYSMRNQRAISIRFPGISLREDPHKTSLKGTKFTQHDFYHSAVTSEMPEVVRKMFIKIGDNLNLGARAHFLKLKSELKRSPDAEKEAKLNKLIEAFGILRFEFWDLDFATFGANERIAKLVKSDGELLPDLIATAAVTLTERFFKDKKTPEKYHIFLLELVEKAFLTLGNASSTKEMNVFIDEFLEI
jgi:hypothetical protein